MCDEFSFDTIYPEKITVYLYYIDDNTSNTDLESILEMEEIKKYFDEFIKINVEYESICLRNTNIENIIEKIYYSNPNNFIVFFNAKFIISDVSYTFSKINNIIREVPTNFDIILFKETNDKNKIREWIENIQLPNLAIVRKDSLYKLIHKKFDDIQIFYSNENITKSFMENLEESIFSIYQNLIDWIG
jgi:hypothetical protein